MREIIGLAVLSWPLVLLIVIGLAFLVAILLAVRYAKRTGSSKWRWGIAAFLLVFLPIFWDWIPTVAMHQYYCANDSGFWVYKTLDQWKADNPGGVGGAQLSIQTTSDGDLQTMNDRFAIETHRRNPIPFLPTSIAERLLVDRKTGEVLAKGVDVGSGVGNMMTGGGWKFWLNQKPCIARDFWKLTSEIEKMRGAI